MTMTARIIQKITSKFIEDKIIFSSNLEIFKYGLLLIISSLKIFAIIFIFSIIFGKVALSTAFSICFFIIRSLCGGYHCSNSKRCFITSILIYFIFVLCSYLPITALENFNYIASVIGTVSIIIFAPIESKNNKVSLKRKKKCKVISVCICVFHIAFLIFLHIDILQLYPLSFSLFTTGNLLLLEYRLHKNI